MPLFDKENQKLNLIRKKEFKNEKELQLLVEENLGSIFNCKLVQSEFYTGAVHAGRIDSLAISEDNNPVIIEYKVVESSQLLNQKFVLLVLVERS